MNKLYFIKLFIKSKFYQMLCKLNIHPLNYYSHSFKKTSYPHHYTKIIDVHKCKLCGKEVKHERN